MKSLLTRTLSGALVVAVMVAAILWSVTSLLVLAMVISAVSTHEFMRLSYPAEKGLLGIRRHGSVIFGGWTVILLIFLLASGELDVNFLLILPVLFFLLVLSIYNKYDPSPLKREAMKVMSLVYIAVPMGLLVILGLQTDVTGVLYYNWGLVLFYVILIWINDVGAYLVGISIGKHRLFERLSPKKSWEGFFGGLIFTVLASVFLGPWMTGMENTPILVWIIFGVVLTLSAVAGDLFESMLKREAGVKDSGNVIPGHGGFLDRFDAMFISLPFVYTMVRLWMA